MGILQARILEWVAYPSPGDLSDPGIPLRSPALLEDSFPAELPGKPKLLRLALKRNLPAVGTCFKVVTAFWKFSFYQPQFLEVVQGNNSKIRGSVE